MATSEEFQNVLVSAAINSTDTTLPTSDYLANLPPLNPQNTAKNFSRFVSRCGPMFTFRDQVILLLSWHKPIDTAAALLVYCLICKSLFSLYSLFYLFTFYVKGLHPKLILFVPHMILIQIIVSGYTKRFGNNKKEETPNHPPPQPKKSVSTSSATTTSRFHFASAFLPATFDENSPEYLKNMQNLQNMMGEMSDLYDLIASHSHFVDWSSETETMRVFQAVLVSLVLLSFIVFFIPLNLLFLAGGVSMFLLNTRFAKFILKEMLPQLTDIGQSQLSAVIQWYTQIEKKLDDQANLRELSLYENQRWWSGSGFIPHTLPNERGLWTNMSGTVELPPKEELSAPEGYQWIEDNWTLDETGPWMDDVLGLEVMVSPENGGWVYTDNNWDNPRNSSSNKSLLVSDNHLPSVTRRRRWVRKCEKKSKQQ